MLRGTVMAAAALAQSRIPAAESEPEPGLVDVNVSLHRWPLRRLAGDDPAALAAKLRAKGVTQAWVGSFDALLHKDLAAVNARLAQDCQWHGKGLFLPFGSVNPTHPDWEEEFRRCVEVHRFRGLRLHPNYHGYRLDHPSVLSLLERAKHRRLVVQVALVMEDERMMHPQWRAEPVDVAPLLNYLREAQPTGLVFINALRTLRGAVLDTVVAAGASVEIAMLEGVGGVANLLERIPKQRMLFGSHAPLFYFESAELKLRESELTSAQSQAIRFENARRLLA